MIKLHVYTANSDRKTERILKPLGTSRVLIPDDKKKEKMKELLPF